MQHNWKQACAIGLLVLAKLIAYCLVGTLQEVAADRVYSVLLQTDWYRLLIAEQKMLIVALLGSQRPSLLKAGTLPLNMITCVEVLKTVYSVGMLLMNSE